MPGREPGLEHVARTKERARRRSPMTEHERGTLVRGGEARGTHDVDVDLEIVLDRVERKPVREPLVERPLLVRPSAQGAELVEQLGGRDAPRDEGLARGVGGSRGRRAPA